MTIVNGINYRLNGRGDVIKSVDSYGNTTEYIWDDNHSLTGFKTVGGNGWSIVGSKKNGGSEITLVNPNQNKFLYRYFHTGTLEVTIDGQPYATFRYENRALSVDYGNYLERYEYDKTGKVKRYEAYPNKATLVNPQFLSFNYDQDGNKTEVKGPSIGWARLSYINGDLKSIDTSRGRVDYFYEARTGRILQVNATWGESIKYDYAGDNLVRAIYKNNDYSKNVAFQNGLPISEVDAIGESAKYTYSQAGLLEKVMDSTGVVGSYSYDNQNRIKAVGLADGSSINFQYNWQRLKKPEDIFLKEVRVTYNASKVSSSPVTKTELAKTEKKEDIRAVLTERIEDIKEASKNLKNGLIIDLFVGDKDVVNSNIADTTGKINRLNDETTNELRKLLVDTSKAEGKLGDTILARWQKFYDANVSSLSGPKTLISFGGTTVKLKPILIIKSNEVNYKYANLEKVPVLANNFIIFIASKIQDGKSVSETSANELVTKINDVPKIKKNNIVFIIRLPKMDIGEQKEWHQEIDELRKIAGKENVLFNPSKDEFNEMLQNRGKDIIAVEMTHTDDGIVLENNVRYTSRDVQAGGDLSHVKYLLSGLCTCQLPRLEKGKFVSSLRGKGVGIVNGSYREVPSDIALGRLRELNDILKDIEDYDLYPYHLIDVIDQRLNILDKGTVNLGKKEEKKTFQSVV